MDGRFADDVNCVLFSNIFFYLDSTIVFLLAGWRNWKDFNVDPCRSAYIRGGNTKFESFFLLLECPYHRPFPRLFFISAASHNTTGYPWAKGNEIEFHNGPLFYLKILTLPPFLFVSLCGDLVIYLEKWQKTQTKLRYSLRSYTKWFHFSFLDPFFWLLRSLNDDLFFCLVRLISELLSSILVHYFGSFHSCCPSFGDPHRFKEVSRHLNTSIGFFKRRLWPFPVYWSLIYWMGPLSSLPFRYVRMISGIVVAGGYRVEWYSRLMAGLRAPEWTDEELL